MQAEGPVTSVGLVLCNSTSTSLCCGLVRPALHPHLPFQLHRVSLVPSKATKRPNIPGPHSGCSPPPVPSPQVAPPAAWRLGDAHDAHLPPGPGAHPASPTPDTRQDSLPKEKSNFYFHRVVLQLGRRGVTGATNE